ncbi:hypothetical protein XENTR_v10022303 [Xenopus tropicalis]|nr:hypothetical protein XENTR_v10022303 [Xenopus tropicalis]
MNDGWLFVSLGFLLKSAVCEEPCEIGYRRVDGAEGGTITLQVHETAFTEISWINVEDGRPIAITRPGTPIEIKDCVFVGRLDSTVDASLNVKSLTMKDQGIYGAVISSSLDEEDCIQHFDLRVSNTKTHATKNIIRVIVSGCVLTLAAGLLFCYIKKHEG